MTTQNAPSAAGPVLESARRSLDRAHEALADQSLSPASAHTTVTAVHQLTNAMAGVVNLLQEQLPAAVVASEAQTERAANELRADLRSLHGCLTTGMRLLEPALTDLRGLAPPARTERIEAAARHRSEPTSRDKGPAPTRSNAQHP